MLVFQYIFGRNGEDTELHAGGDIGCKGTEAAQVNEEMGKQRKHGVKP